LSGDLFPHFIPDLPTSPETGFASVFLQHAKDHQEYAKLIFWCFVAGFSERFVTDVIGRFEGTAIKDAPQARVPPFPAAQERSSSKEMNHEPTR
jgi:hypothetical protein